MEVVSTESESCLVFNLLHNWSSRLNQLIGTRRQMKDYVRGLIWPKRCTFILSLVLTCYQSIEKYSSKQGPLCYFNHLMVGEWKTKPTKN